MPWRRRIPAPSGVLALGYALGGVLCLLTAAAPPSPRTPVALDLAAAVIAAAVVAGLLRGGRAVPTALRAGLTVLAGLLVSLLVGTAATRSGQILIAFAYPWVGFYAALYLPRRLTLGVLATVLASFAVGLAAGGHTGPAGIWLTVSPTVVAATLILGERNARLLANAHRDELTGLLNRAGLVAAAERCLAHAARGGAPLTTLALDLDGLKAVNDGAGHAAGDRMLAEAATGWRAVLRGTDVIARVGGDEFVILLADTGPDGAAVALERLRGGWPGAFSAGAATWQHGETFDDVLRRADEELYRAKSRVAELRTDARRPVGAVSAARA